MALIATYGVPGIIAVFGAGLLLFGWLAKAGGQATGQIPSVVVFPFEVTDRRKKIARWTGSCAMVVAAALMIAYASPGGRRPRPSGVRAQARWQGDALALDADGTARRKTEVTAPGGKGAENEHGNGTQSHTEAAAPHPSDDGDVNTLFLPSGWMGKDIGKGLLTEPQERMRLERSLRFEDDWAKDVHTRPTCYRLSYLRQAESPWIAIAWQYPEANWGDRWGRNLSKFHRLTFWARADTCGPDLKVGFKVGDHTRDDAEYPSSCPEPAERWIALSQRWQQYAIDLRDYNLTNLPIGFVFLVRRQEYPNGGTFYLDDIRFEK